MAKIPLQKLEDNVNNYARIGLNRSAQRVEERLSQNAGLTDHDLDNLATLGHPYSRNFYQQIHTPPYLVHRQSGRLQDNIRIVKENKDTVAIGVNPDAVPYLDDVVEGNARMVPRNFPLETLREVVDEDIIYNTMEEAIKAGVKKS